VGVRRNRLDRLSFRLVILEVLGEDYRLFKLQVIFKRHLGGEGTLKDYRARFEPERAAPEFRIVRERAFVPPCHSLEAGSVEELARHWRDSRH